MSESTSIESEVPGEQKLREGEARADKENSTLGPSAKAQTSLQEGASERNATLSKGDTGEIATPDDFTLEPVITVTKQESTLTKGEMKLQTVTVTEDISRTSEAEGAVINRRLTYEIHTKIPHPAPTAYGSKRDDPKAPNTQERESTESKGGRSRIPMARFRQAVDRVKRERKEIKNAEKTIPNTHRKSSIPRLKDSKIPHPTVSKEVTVVDREESVAVSGEDEFDKIFREISEKETTFEISSSRDQSQIESSFEEIIHAYEENTTQTGGEKIKQSRIPLLKRRSEHEIELSQNREKFRKSISADTDQVISPINQTTYTAERYATTETKAYADTSTERVTYRSKKSYGNDLSVKKRQRITNEGDIYDRIVGTGETLENKNKVRDNVDKERVDMDSIEATVPVFDETDDMLTIDGNEAVVPSDVTESYDDINMSSDTQLTRITSEQVRFDKQIVSKIYKIDFTENTFELTDSEATDVSNFTQQLDGKERKETILSSISKNDSMSTVVHEGEKEKKTVSTINDLENTAQKIEISEYNDVNKKSVSKSYLIESSQSSVMTHKDLLQYQVSNKSYSKRMTENSSPEDYTTCRVNVTNDDLEISKDLVIGNSTKEIKGIVSNLVTENSAKELKDTGENVNSFTKDSTKEIKHTSKVITDQVANDTIKDVKYTASELVTQVGTEEKKETLKQVTKVYTSNDSKDYVAKDSVLAKDKTHDVSNKTVFLVKNITKHVRDMEDNTPGLLASGKKEINVTSNNAANKTEVIESPTTTTNYHNFDRQYSSQTAAVKATDNSYDMTKQTSAPLIAKTAKSDVNGKKTDHDEETYKIYSDVFTKISAARKISTGYETKTEKNTVLEESSTETDTVRDMSVPENEIDSEENIPILRGKVNRIIRRISSIDNSKVDEGKVVKDVPKKKTILSRIAMFERDEPNEPYPKVPMPHSESKQPRGLAALRQISRDSRSPRIVDEIFKEYSDRRKFNSTTNLTNKNKNEEEITIEIKNEKDLNRSDSTFKSKLYDYKTVKDFSELQVAKTQLNRSSREDVRTEGKRIDIEKATVSSSSPSPMNGRNQQETEEKRTQPSSEGKLYNGQYESSFKITNSLTISKTNISQEDLNTLKHSYTTKTELRKEKSTISDSVQLKESPRSNGKETIDSSHKEVTKEVRTTEKTERRRELRRRDSDLRRATSVVEQDLGDVIKGKVKGIITRINSMERIEQTSKKIEDKERPRGSVSERIAMFEGKVSTAKAERSTEVRRKTYRAVETLPQEIDEEACSKRIAELKEAKNNYGATSSSYMELRDGTKMPVIALGTALLIPGLVEQITVIAQAFSFKIDKRLVRHVVEAAIDLGYRAIDTAFIYGNEREVGQGINAKITDGTVKREDLYIISKLWSTFHRRDLVERACRSSLEAMGLTYFDLYLIHNPISLKEGSDPLPKIANVLQFSEHDFMDAWYGIEGLVSSGLAVSGGLSNFNSEQVHRVADKGRLKPVVNQVECHPYLSQDRLSGFCEAFGIKLVCYGALGSKGTPKALKSALPPAIEDPLVQVMAAGLGITPAQLLLAFQVRKGRAVVAKASSAARLHENLIAQRVPLAAGQLTALSALDRHKRTYTLEGFGETHKNYPFKIAF